MSVLWKSYFELLRAHFGECAVEELLWPMQGPFWRLCCGKATLAYPGTILASLLWKSYFGLCRNHFGECAVEELLWPTQGPFWRACCGKVAPLWRACCGRATLSYSGTILASVLWKSYFGLLRDHFGESAAEELLWPTRDHIIYWRVCCGKATLGYSGPTLASVLWKRYFGLLRVCCGRATLGYSGITLASVLWKSYFAANELLSRKNKDTFPFFHPPQACYKMWAHWQSCSFGILLLIPFVCTCQF